MLKKILAILCAVTLVVGLIPAVYAADEDSVIVSLQDFEAMNAGDTISTTATSGWKLQGSGSGAEIVSDEGGNKIKFTPSTSGTPELLYIFSSAAKGKSVRLTFKTMIEESSPYTKRIGLRSGSTTASYGFFHSSLEARAGSSAKGLGTVEDFKYKENVWYDVVMDINPSDGYVKFEFSDGESTFVTQSVASTALSNGLTSIIFHSDKASSSGNAWYIDDVKLEELPENVSKYDAKTVMVNNNKFTYMAENYDLIAGGADNWAAATSVPDSASSVTVKSENGNKYAEITAAPGGYTELKKNYTSFKKSDIENIEVDFSIRFSDKNYKKTLNLKGGDIDRAYITFTTDGKVHIGDSTEGHDRNSIPNFIYETDKWYDFSYKLNTNTGFAYISVNDGENTYDALAKDIGTIDGFSRLSFVVDSGIKNASSTFSIDNIHMKEIDAFETEYVNISDIVYSAESVQPGEISASVSGQVYGETEYTLYLAIYTPGQKQLINVDVIPVKAEGYEKTFTAKIDVPDDGNSYEVRAFLFDRNLTPVQTVDALK